MVDIKVKSLKFLIIFSIGLLFSFEFYISSSVRMHLDTALLHYVAFLVSEHNLSLYKDVFETSMAGSFIFHIVIGKLFGFGSIDEYFGLINIVYLSFILIITYFIMIKFDKFSALLSVFLFAILYFRNGPELVLQRDYLTILPISLSILIASLNISKLKISIFIGILFGIVVSIKPHLGIGLPFIMIYMLIDSKKDRYLTLNFIKELFKYGFISIFALISVLFLEGVWLYSMDSIDSFWFLFSQYLPLHLDLGHNYEMLSNRLEYLIYGYFTLLGFLEYPYYKLIIVVMFVSLYFLIFKIELNFAQKRVLWLIVSLAIFYSLVVGLGGKFWGYHWIVFTYFVSLISSLIIFNSKLNINYERVRLITILLFIVLSLFNISNIKHFIYTYTYGKYGLYPKDGMVDEVACFLKKNLKDGERVQPIDWSTGSIHAMLLSESRLATKYMYDYHFYHHIDSNITQGLRDDFISQLKDVKPKYLIDVYWDYKAYPTGPNTSIEFKELDEFKKDYSVVKKGVMYEILERNSVKDN